MVRRQPCFFESDHRNTRVPHRRNAWLQTNRVALFDLEPRKFSNLAPGQRVIRPMVERDQGKDRIHHRRIDGGQSLGALNMVKHPRLGFAQCTLP